MSYKYYFPINHINSRIESHSSTYSADFSILKFEEDDSTPFYGFTSSHLSSLSDPKEIWARGLFILLLYKGAYNLDINPLGELDMENRLSFSRLYDWENELFIQVPNYHEIVPYVSFCEDILNEPIKYPYAKYELDPIPHRIHEARTNPKVKNLLLQLGNGLDWANLYAILDSVKTYSKQIHKGHYIKILTQAGFDKKAEKKFTGTANNFGLLSTASRHGDMNYQIPNETMKLNEAKSFILKVCKSFLKISYNC